MDKAKALAEKQKGNDAFAKKQWAEAIGFYSAARLADASEPTIPLNRAMAYLKLSKFLDAERDCTTALELSPNNVKALYRRATARMGADKFEAAREDYNNVLRLDAGNAEAKAGLAKANEALERAKKRRTDPYRSATVAPEGSSANSAPMQTALIWGLRTEAPPKSTRIAQSRQRESSFSKWNVGWPRRAGFWLEAHLFCRERAVKVSRRDGRSTARGDYTQDSKSGHRQRRHAA